MARTIDEIKESLTDRFMAHATVRDRYGMENGDEFDGVFSRFALENILFDNLAIEINDLEQLMDMHVAEVTEMLSLHKAHRSRWYQQKTLAYMDDMTLMDETDLYDTTDMSDADIATARIVKYCAVPSERGSDEIIVKIATVVGGVKVPVSDEQKVRIISYLYEVGDAGVTIRLVNLPGAILELEADVYYDTLLSPDTVRVACVDAAQAYINNLPFDGEYTNMALSNALQSVAGVKVVQHRWSREVNDLGGVIAVIDARYLPIPGYFNLGAVTINMLPYAL